MASQITKTLFGTTDEGQEVYKFTIENKNGLALEVISYGSVVVGIRCPDKYVVLLQISVLNCNNFICRS